MKVAGTFVNTEMEVQMKTKRGAQKYPFGRVIRFLPQNRIPDMPKAKTHVQGKKQEPKAVKPEALESKKID